MKIVLDTNVWLSGIFWQGNPYQIIKSAEKGPFTVILSKPILQEIAKVLNREAKFQKFLSEKTLELEQLLKKIIEMSEIVDVKTTLNVISEDPEDNKVLEAAVDGDADYIVSGDRHLLQIKKFGKTKILSPREFLDITSH